MSRLTWIETLDGWRSGPYQIELAAPHLWVLTRRVKRYGFGLGPVEVMRTAGSLRQLKRLAQEEARRRSRRRRLVIHVVVMLLLIAGAAISSALGWGLTIPALVGVFAVALRTLVEWIDSATGSAWSVLSDVYQ